jgi:serine phosphatase RsbU (regulator of sigma subunit)
MWPNSRTVAGSRPSSPPPLPASEAYHSEIVFLPYERLGHHWFSGDWYAGRHHEDGSLWVLLADVTGHGYWAHLLASALPEVWERCWALLPPGPPQPADVLAVMHELLADCLPEGVFLECTLACLHPGGQATVAPAGATRLLLRRASAERPDLLLLRGMWLGLCPPTRADQHTCVLAHGDEILLATDGVFDQLTEEGAVLGEGLPEELAGPGPLLQRVRALLDRALERAPQKDDITLVLIRRRGPGPEATLVSAGAAPHHRAGDVPV